MRRIFLLLALAVITATALAQRLTEQQAKERAASFMKYKHGTALAKGAATRAAGLKTVSLGIDGIYLFNVDGGGYVVAGGDARVAPVLGYGDGGDVGGGQLGELREVEREGEVEIGEVNARIDALDVDVGRVFTVLDHAKVAAHESAGAVLTVDGAARAAATEHAAGLVFADEAAGGPAAGDRAGEGAVFNRAVEIAGYRRIVVGRLVAAEVGQRKVFYRAAKCFEEGAARHAQAVDAVAVAVAKYADTLSRL